MAKNIDFMGAVFPDVPSVKLPQQGGGLVAFDDTTDATATADKILEGYTAYAGGEKLVGTASGGITPSGTYSITSNGIYDIVSFASVDVNVSGGGGGDHDVEDAIIARTISGVYENSRVTSIGNSAFLGCNHLTGASFPSALSIGTYAFSNCSRLTLASFPNVTDIGSNAFNTCTSLATVYFPNATYIGRSAFYTCKSLTTVYFPSAIYITSHAFAYCSNLTMASFPNASTLGVAAFSGCSKLMSVYLLASSVATLGASVFNNTPMSKSTYTGSFGSIYVPASLVDTYKSATNWSSYSARITAYEG